MSFSPEDIGKQLGILQDTLMERATNQVSQAFLPRPNQDAFNVPRTAVVPSYINQERFKKVENRKLEKHTEEKGNRSTRSSSHQ